MVGGDRCVSRWLHHWSSDTLLHPWSFIIIIIIIILVEVEQGLEATYGLVQFGSLLEEWDGWLGGPVVRPVSQ